jgi:hypothetical protein
MNSLPPLPELKKPVSEAQLERIVEHLIDIADDIFMHSNTTQEEYSEWYTSLIRWAASMGMGQ